MGTYAQDRENPPTISSEPNNVDLGMWNVDASSQLQCIGTIVFQEICSMSTMNVYPPE